MPVRTSIGWIDLGGNERLTQLTSAAGSFLTLVDVANLSNAIPQNFHAGNITTGALGAPGITPYASVGDTVAISAIDGVGTSYRFMIPAPVQGLFTTDENTVDVTNPLFFTLNAQAAFTLIVPQTSLDVINLLAGWLFRRTPNIRESYTVDNTHPTLRCCAVWQDSFGRTRLTTYNSVGPTAAFLTAAQACSNALIIQSWEGSLQIVPGPTPSAGIYTSVLDAARMVYSDDRGNRTQVIIPAPQLAMFKADAKTVDPSFVLVSQLNADMLVEGVVPTSGRPVVKFLGGTLIRSNLEGTA